MPQILLNSNTAGKPGSTYRHDKRRPDQNTEVAEELCCRNAPDPPRPSKVTAVPSQTAEIKAMVDKVRSACKKRDSVTAHAAARALQDESLMPPPCGMAKGTSDFNLFKGILRQSSNPELQTGRLPRWGVWTHCSNGLPT